MPYKDTTAAQGGHTSGLQVSSLYVGGWRMHLWAGQHFIVGTAGQLRPAGALSAACGSLGRSPCLL